MSQQSHLRNLPAVDALLKHPELLPLIRTMGRQTVLDIAREVLDRTRLQLVEGHGNDPTPLRDRIATEVKDHCLRAQRPFHRKAVNATGIILHTGLGRAVLPTRAIHQIQEELTGYSLLQVDIETGKRSRRDQAIERLLQRLTGCESATVVNNNAAATAIVLNTLAKGKEVIVSRGQLVEIGGSFRLPDVMAFSGARLVEVGTTNKTHARDYVNAITEDTAAILRVHPSNYSIQGFTSEVGMEELVEIAHSHNLPMVDDVGAGALLDMTRFGFAPEPTLPDSIRMGADLVLCSGDKLIGASQAGLILGKRDLIEAIRKNQFARIVRPGKLTLTVLEATLKLFLDRDLARGEVPTLRMIVRSPEDLRQQAELMVGSLKQKISDRAHVTAIAGFSQTGSGSLPGQNLPTTCVAIQPKAIGVEDLTLSLRAHDPPIFARIQDDHVLIDPRTLLPGENQCVIEALVMILLK